MSMSSRGRHFELVLKSLERSSTTAKSQALVDLDLRTTFSSYVSTVTFQNNFIAHPSVQDIQRLQLQLQVQVLQATIHEELNNPDQGIELGQGLAGAPSPDEGCE